MLEGMSSSLDFSFDSFFHDPFLWVLTLWGGCGGFFFWFCGYLFFFPFKGVLAIFVVHVFSLPGRPLDLFLWYLSRVLGPDDFAVSDKLLETLQFLLPFRKKVAPIPRGRLVLQVASVCTPLVHEVSETVPLFFASETLSLSRWQVNPY